MTAFGLNPFLSDSDSRQVGANLFIGNLEPEEGKHGETKKKGKKAKRLPTRFLPGGISILLFFLVSFDF